MISLQEVEEIHQTLIDIFGGSHGIRDLPALDAALARPFQSFDNKDLHPTPIHKAASLIESILINHPFIDGNKRTGYVLMRILLINNGLDIAASQDEKYKFVISIAFPSVSPPQRDTDVDIIFFKNDNNTAASCLGRDTAKNDTTVSLRKTRPTLFSSPTPYH